MASLSLHDECLKLVTFEDLESALYRKNDIILKNYLPGIDTFISTKHTLNYANVEEHLNENVLFKTDFSFDVQNLKIFEPLKSLSSEELSDFNYSLDSQRSSPDIFVDDLTTTSHDHKQWLSIPYFDDVISNFDDLCGKDEEDLKKSSFQKCNCKTDRGKMKSRNDQEKIISNDDVCQKNVKARHTANAPTCPSTSKTTKSRRKKPRQKRSTSTNKRLRIADFLLYELEKSANSNNSIIRWLDSSCCLFQVMDSREVARRWGLQKEKTDMTWEKLSRGIRFQTPLVRLLNNSQISAEDCASYDFERILSTDNYPKKLVFKFNRSSVLRYYNHAASKRRRLSQCDYHKACL